MPIEEVVEGIEEDPKGVIYVALGFLLLPPIFALWNGGLVFLFLWLLRSI